MKKTVRRIPISERQLRTMVSEITNKIIAESFNQPLVNEEPSPEEDEFESEFIGLLQTLTPTLAKHGLDINNFKRWCLELIDKYYGE